MRREMRCQWYGVLLRTTVPNQIDPQIWCSARSVTSFLAASALEISDRDRDCALDLQLAVADALLRWV